MSEEDLKQMEEHADRVSNYSGISPALILMNPFAALIFWNRVLSTALTNKK